MSNKVKKKRNKQYQGSGAAQVRPAITHVTAVKRNKFQLWWLEKKRIVKPVSIAVGVVTALGVIIYELFRLFL